MKKKYALILLSQFIIILFAGFFSKDSLFAILISAVGITFNFLVSIGRPAGFWFGFIYALANGALSFHTKVYAAFAFMIFMQAPMALYSYFSWKRKAINHKQRLKSLSHSGIGCLCIGMCGVLIGLYFLLSRLGSTAVVIDAAFFTCSAAACVLLAICYKCAYIVTLLSGLGGAVLWGYQAAYTGTGFSIAAFYCIVTFNSIIAVYREYKN